MRWERPSCFPKDGYSFPKVRSLNRYIGPKTGKVLVEVGDTLTPEVVQGLGTRGAIRVKTDVGLERQAALEILRLQADVLEAGGNRPVSG